MGDSFSMVPRLATFIMFISRAGPMRTLSHTLRVLMLDLDCCEVVCTLCRHVSIFLLFSWRVLSQSIGLCQLLLRNLDLVTLEQWCLRCLLSRVRSPDAVGSWRWFRFRKILVLHDGELLDFDCTDQTKRIVRCMCITEGAPKYFE